MPFYDFNCQECGHQHNDKLVKSFDEVILCPICNTEMVKGMSCGSFVIDPATPRGM